MGYHAVHHSHAVPFLGTIGLAKKENLPSKLLAHLTGEIRGAKTAVKARHIRVCLTEDRVLATGNG